MLLHQKSPQVPYITPWPAAPLTSCCPLPRSSSGGWSVLAGAQASLCRLLWQQTHSDKEGRAGIPALLPLSVWLPEEGMSVLLPGLVSHQMKRIQRECTG